MEIGTRSGTGIVIESRIVCPLDYRRLCRNSRALFAEMDRKQTSVWITRLMFQALRDVRLLIRLGLIRRLKVKGDNVAALKALEAINYEGPYAGFLATYIVRTMLLARDGRAFEYVNSVRRFIRDESGELKYRGYCLAYCKYLRRVLEGYPYELAATDVLAQPSTAFVRDTLRVIRLPSIGWQKIGASPNVDG